MMPSRGHIWSEALVGPEYLSTQPRRAVTVPERACALDLRNASLQKSVTKRASKGLSKLGADSQILYPRLNFDRSVKPPGIGYLLTCGQSDEAISLENFLLKRKNCVTVKCMAKCG